VAFDTSLLQKRGDLAIERNLRRSGGPRHENQDKAEYTPALEHLASLTHETLHWAKQAREDGIGKPNHWLSWETRFGTSPDLACLLEPAAAARALAIQAAYERHKRHRLWQRRNRLEGQWSTMRIVAVRDTAN
jgi:hypothetical protein